jgi:hypothetical protein
VVLSGVACQSSSRRAAHLEICILRGADQCRQRRFAFEISECADGFAPNPRVWVGERFEARCERSLDAQISQAPPRRDAHLGRLVIDEGQKGRRGVRRFQLCKAQSGGGGDRRVIVEQRACERPRCGETVELLESLHRLAPHAGVGIFERADEQRFGAGLSRLGKIQHGDAPLSRVSTRQPLRDLGQIGMDILEEFAAHGLNATDREWSR